MRTSQAARILGAIAVLAFGSIIGRAQSQLGQMREVSHQAQQETRKHQERKTA